jgi:Fe-S-cluster containining protein
MKDKKQSRTGYYQIKRQHFPVDEKKHPWLGMLLDAYCVVDKGVSEAVKMELKKGRKLACTKGCSHCCKTHQTIPVYPLELVGLSWYVTEKLKGTARKIVRMQLEKYKENDPCPFLVDGACSVHPMRPVSCRQFNVFDTPCSEGEDPYYTRRIDVLSPIKNYRDRAFFIMLPFYGVEDEKERWRIIESDLVHQVVQLMQTCNWKSLAARMAEFERGSSAE